MRITHEEATAEPVHEIIHSHGWDILFGQGKRGGRLFVVSGDDSLEVGDVVSVVGSVEDVDAATRLRRGDVKFIQHGDTMLELGDRREGRPNRRC